MGRLRRTTELGLLILAVVIIAGAYTLASLGQRSTIPADIVPFLGLLLALFIGAHIAVRKLAPNADGVLLPIAALLNGIGYVFIVRIDEAKANPAGLAGLQLTWTALGVVGFVLTLLFVRRARDLERSRYTFLLIGMVLLVLPLVPGIGREINGSRIWVSLGPVNFQPGEFAKIALSLFFAGYLVERRELLAISTWRLGPLHLPDPKVLGPVLLAWGFSLVVMTAQKDLGSSLLFFTLFVVMLWIATERTGYLAIGGVLFTGGALFAWRTFNHVQERVDIWLDPWPVAKDKGFQIVESAFAIADGRMTGVGLGLGNPLRIPVVETDFIFAAIAEELGLFGATAVLVAFMLMIGSGLRIAVRADHPFEKLLAAGLTTLLGIQSFIIIAGVIRVLPLTGVTLPFVSYGGSSLVANYILLAIMLRISDNKMTRVREGELEAVR